MLKRWRRGGNEILHQEGGYTLPELVMAMTIGLVVCGAAVTVLTVGARSQPRVTGQAAEIQQGRALIEQITRELRQGSDVTAATASQLSVLTYVDRAACGGAHAPVSIQCRVSYTCVSSTCTRTERLPDGTGGGAAVEVVRGLEGPSVFSFLPDAAEPSYVGVQLAFPAEGDNQGITVQDGVALRNLTPAGP